MKETVNTRGLSAGSLFKIVFVGYFLSLGPILLLFGVLSIFGSETVRLNDEPVKGIAGFLLSLVMIPIFVVAASVITWLLLASGNWLYTRWRNITISYTDVALQGADSDRGAAGQSAWRVTSYEPSPGALPRQKPNP
jgi:hypothetical protein